MWDVKGKVALITGATNGIGKETALGLARSGAMVVIHGRNPSKTEGVAREITQKTGNKNVDMIIGDLSSLSDVKKIAEEFQSKYNSLNILINNAGGLYMDEPVSRDGFEMTFAVNYLSHFLLTNLLLDLIKNSGPSRIIHLSSSAHKMMNGINIEKVYKPCAYGFLVYCAAKLCVTMFAYELADRLKGTNVTSNALHPGMVKTGFGSNNNNIFWKIFAPFCFAISIPPEKGASTSLFLATSNDLEGITSKYFVGSREKTSTKLSYNREKQKELWKLSENLVKDFL